MLAMPVLRKVALPLFLSIALAGGAMAAPTSTGFDTSLGKVPGAGAPASVDDAGVQQAYDGLPLSFVPNRGQLDPEVHFYAQGSGYGFYATATGMRVALTEGERGHAVDLAFVGAEATVPRARGALPGRVNYLIGADPAGWNTGLPTYKQVVYPELWPGVDMVFFGADGELKYEFHLDPGAKPSDIRLAYRGADGVALDGAGNLLITTSLGPLTDAAPVSFQQVGGTRVPVQSSFALDPDGTFRFSVGEYEPTRRLVIDPGLAYSTFIGGSGGEICRGIALDASGAAYVTGLTNSADFPTTPGSFDTDHNGGTDVFVTKLNPAASALVYSTFIGGSDSIRREQAHSIAVDAFGSAYIAGETGSSDFPTTPGAFDTTFNGISDAFVTKLDPTGSALVYSTFLGGNDDEQAQDVAVDAAGSVYVTGFTESSNFPTSVGAFDTTFNGLTDVFVTKLDPTGSTLAYSTLVGGSDFDRGNNVAVDASGAAYVAGGTRSADFPTTSDAFDTTFNEGVFDAFVTKVDPTGSVLVYSTFLGGGEQDRGLGIALDPSGSAYVTGVTGSADFPTTPGAFDTTFNGGLGDAFVTKVDPTGADIAYSTFLGGSGGSSDLGREIAVDASGLAYVVGTTGSSDFPTTPGAFDTTFNGGLDAFVTKVDATGADIAYSTFLGGSGGDSGHDIAVDASGAVYVSGDTFSAGFPTTPGAFDTSHNGQNDVFVTKLTTVSEPATLTLDPPAAVNPVGTSHTVTATVNDASGNRVPDVVVRFEVTGSVTDSGSCTTDANGQCSFTYQGPELPGSDVITAFADTDGDGTQGPGEPSGLATKTWVFPATTPGCEVNISNGGRITAANGDKATFGGNAKASEEESVVTGQQQYHDHGPAQPMNVHSINVLAVVCGPDGTQADIFGTATMDGAGSFEFRIRVEDHGEPGRAVDRYGILLSSGYDSGVQTLEGGNIQIKR